MLWCDFRVPIPDLQTRTPCYGDDDLQLPIRSSLVDDHPRIEIFAIFIELCVMKMNTSRNLIDPGFFEGIDHGSPFGSKSRCYVVVPPHEFSGFSCIAREFSRGRPPTNQDFDDFHRALRDENEHFSQLDRSWIFRRD